MSETLKPYGGSGSLDTEREISEKEVRALEFYISGMVNHPSSMPWAYKDLKTGELKVEGDTGQMDPPIRLATIPSRELYDGLVRGDRSVTFNPQTNILENRGIPITLQTP